MKQQGEWDEDAEWHAQIRSEMNTSGVQRQCFRLPKISLRKYWHGNDVSWRRKEEHTARKVSRLDISGKRREDDQKHDACQRVMKSIELRASEDMNWAAWRRKIMSHTRDSKIQKLQEKNMKKRLNELHSVCISVQTNKQMPQVTVDECLAKHIFNPYLQVWREAWLLDTL